MGDGTAFLILDSISITLNPSHNYKCFKYSYVRLKLPSSALTVLNIYRPPTSSKYSQVVCVFLDEFQTFPSSAATTQHEFIITVDFSKHLDDPLDSSSQQCTDLISSTNLIRHFSVSIHIHNHLMDLVIILLILISIQHFHNFILLYLITFLFSLTLTLPRHSSTPF